MNETNNDLKCKYCSRQFKRKSPKQKHEKQQICLPKQSRTICQICNITFNSIKEYQDHLISNQHITNLLTNKDTEIIKQKQKTALDLDPFLNNNEKSELQNGNSTVTLQFNNNGKIQKQKLNLDEETQLEKQINSIKEQNEYVEHIAERNDIQNKGVSSYQELIQQEIYNKPIPNENQEKILSKLVDLNDELSDDKQKVFLQILKYLDEDDADFMTTYIRDCQGLDLESKQIYLELINKFVMKLTQIFNQGYTQIGGKNIINFISKLSK